MRISDWSSDVCSSDLTIAVGVDAARREIVEILRRPVDDDTRRVLRDALIADDAEVIELFLPESGDAERHILQPRGTARRGHDDVMVVARAIAGTALRGRVGRRGGLARLGHRSEARRVGQEWVSTCRSRWSPCQ